MATYSFEEGIPAGFASLLEEDLFFHPHQLNLQSSQGWHSFSIQNRIEKKIVAVLHVHVDGALAKSPYRSPYGSFAFVDDISSSMLFEFILFIVNKLRDKGVHNIQLVNSPEAYHAGKSELLNNVLAKSGFEITREEISAIIPVTHASFQSILHRSEKKRLKKCETAGLTLTILPQDQLDSVYEFLLNCRIKKGYALSMTSAELRKAMHLFPDRFFLFAVRHNDEIAAASISIRVRSNVLYNYSHDHASRFDELSPVVMLNMGLYQFCQQHDIRLLDLGTSTVDGSLKESLYTFKLRLGTEPSRKLTYTKKLD